MGPPHARRAFTLIELLVVIAIIALLVAMLIPALSKAKDITRRMVCAANFKNTGTGMHSYAATHQGRFPNKAAGTYESRGYLGGGSGPWLPVWMNLLNREWFKQNDPSFYPRAGYTWIDEPTCGPIIRFWTFWSPTNYKLEYLKNRYMSCPCYKPWGDPSGYSNNWSRPWIANRMATGGVSWISGGSETYESWPGELGQRLANPKTINTNYIDYALGTRQDLFVNASSKYLIFEGERGSDVTHQSGDSANGGVITLYDNVDYVPWAGQNGTFAFRHMLSVDQTLWQQQAQANVLYVDGHVGLLSPNDPVALGKRFMPDM